MVIFYYVSFPARVVSEFTQVKFPTQSEGKPIPKRQVENTKAAQQLAELIFKSVVDPPPGFCFSRMRLSGDSVPLRFSSLGSQHCPKVPLPWSRRASKLDILKGPAEQSWDGRRACLWARGFVSIDVWKEAQPIVTHLCASDSLWDNQLLITAALPPLAGWVLHLKRAAGGQSKTLAPGGSGCAEPEGGRLIQQPPCL